MNLNQHVCDVIIKIMINLRWKYNVLKYLPSNVYILYESFTASKTGQAGDSLKHLVFFENNIIVNVI